jgi:8-amino-7-oxononanoate synthase
VSLLGDLEVDLSRITERGLRRELRPGHGPQEATFTLGDRQVDNFSSNNYLGLANHPALLAAARRTLEVEGLGAGASRLIAGNLAAHQRLEAKLAHFHQREAALLFNAGYLANLGVITALANPEDIIFSDELNHASIVDGCRLSRARIAIFSHRGVEDLAQGLRSAAGFRRRFIITDSLFSMDGDLAPLREYRALADQFDASLIVDEAHATGVFGEMGRGLAAELDVPVDVHIATLGKSFGAFGAYVTGSRVLIDFLINRARSFIFTTALPPAVIAAAEAALDLIAGAEGEQLRERLRANIQRFATALGHSGTTPIFPVFLPTNGTELRTMELSEALLARGIFAQGIRPPTVPTGSSRLRFALMATHTPEQIDRAVAALRELL